MIAQKKQAGPKARPNRHGWLRKAHMTQSAVIRPAHRAQATLMFCRSSVPAPVRGFQPNPLALPIGRSGPIVYSSSSSSGSVVEPELAEMRELNSAGESFPSAFASAEVKFFESEG